MAQINKARDNPRKDTSFETLENYKDGVPFPFLIFSDHGGDPDFRWIIEHHPVFHTQQFMLFVMRSERVYLICVISQFLVLVCTIILMFGYVEATF